MYGLVNKAIQDLVVREFGESTWQEIATAAGFDVMHARAGRGTGELRPPSFAFERGAGGGCDHDVFLIRPAG